jgi:hypothetical protein
MDAPFLPLVVADDTQCLARSGNGVRGLAMHD